MSFELAFIIFCILIATPVLKPETKTTGNDKLGKKADKRKNWAGLFEAYCHDFKELQNLNFVKQGNGNEQI